MERLRHSSWFCMYFFQFNTSLSDVLTNLVHGEHCSRYQLTAIRGTNAFFGIVNETCTMMRAFCPCSMVSENIKHTTLNQFCGKNTRVSPWKVTCRWVNRGIMLDHRLYWPNKRNYCQELEDRQIQIGPVYTGKMSSNFNMWILLLQIDRLCLNCHRMEQTECECPCECPLDMDFCTGELLDSEDRYVCMC